MHFGPFVVNLCPWKAIKDINGWDDVSCTVPESLTYLVFSARTVRGLCHPNASELPWDCSHYMALPDQVSLSDRRGSKNGMYFAWAGR